MLSELHDLQKKKCCDYKSKIFYSEILFMIIVFFIHVFIYVFNDVFIWSFPILNMQSMICFLVIIGNYGRFFKEIEIILCTEFKRDQ